VIFDRAALYGAVLAAGLGLAATATAMIYRAQRDTARAAYAVAAEAARSSAAALAQATAQHIRDMAAVSADAERARAAAITLQSALEAIRNDPTHDAAAADVLGRAVDLLRQPGAAAGGADPAPGAAPGAAGVR
jgi:altronate dehydratase